MSEIWLTHPDLPGQDIKVRRDALGSYAVSGWQMRPDQSDPAPDVEPEAPAVEDEQAVDDTDDETGDEPLDTDPEMEI